MAPAVLIAIDGLRPDALAVARCPNLAALSRRGAWTLAATSVVPPVSLPCFMSIFHSQPPQRHGVTTNTWVVTEDRAPGLVEVAHAAGLRCAFVYNWKPLHHLHQPDSLASSCFLDNLHDVPHGDIAVAAQAARSLRNVRHDFTFVYLGTLDIAGHDHGWMSQPYLQCLEALDATLQVMLDAMSPSATVLVTADHGGHNTSHGLELPEDMTVPMFFAGPTIRQGYEIEPPVSLLDVAPTLAHVLGLAAPASWEGRSLDAIFSARAQAGV